MSEIASAPIVEGAAEETHTAGSDGLGGAGPGAGSHAGRFRTRDAALDYRSGLGWALLPIRAGSKEPNALALECVYGHTGWKHLTGTPATEDDIRRWFEADPSTNVAVLTGKPSGGLVIADYDRGVPPAIGTPTVATSRGVHVYTIASEPVATTKTTFGEIRGDGSYTLLPYSTHPSGERYEWVIPPERAPFVSYSRDLFETGAGGGTDQPQYSGWWGRGDRWIAAAMAVLGIEAPTVHSAFRCPIPGHEERHPSASLFRMRDGRVMLRDWHRRGSRDWVPLPDVFASQLHGEEVKLTAGERRSWLARLELEMGVREPLPVQLPPLPRDATETMGKVAEGFRLLLAVEGAESAPYTRRFAARWCGVSPWRAGQAIDRLLACGVLRVDRWERLYGREKGTPFFRLGEGSR